MSYSKKPFYLSEGSVKGVDNIRIQTNIETNEKKLVKIRPTVKSYCYVRTCTHVCVFGFLMYLKHKEICFIHVSWIMS